ncbi:type 4 pilus major pilin [Vibrio mediterranei]|uniref:Type 4 secretion system PilS N-terminal domain-containing protein n=1 Tax=Vibrio mediterranei TaxID=689 RepID=A0A3G4VCX6_9VIBR|nr:type 4 pilus major pilin [Vibrio mediterranei]AYV21021.1 hypothetical protein ECB94_06710 [Vibrio mediterranei]
MKFTAGKRKNKNNQKGIALLEMIIAIGIIGIITAAVVALATKAFDEQKKKDTISKISEITTTVQQLYSNAPSYLGLTDADLNADLLKNPYGGAFKLNVGEVSGTAAGGFSIEIKGLSPDQCVQLLSAIGKNFLYAKVGASVPSDLSASDGKPADFKPATLKTACANASSANALYLGER